MLGVSINNSIEPNSSTDPTKQEGKDAKEAKSPKKELKRRFSAGKDLSKLGELPLEDKNSNDKCMTARINSVKDLNFPDLNQLLLNSPESSRLLKKPIDYFLRKKK